MAFKHGSDKSALETISCSQKSKAIGPGTDGKLWQSGTRDRLPKQFRKPHEGHAASLNPTLEGCNSELLSQGYEVDQTAEQRRIGTRELNLPHICRVGAHQRLMRRAQEISSASR